MIISRDDRSITYYSELADLLISSYTFTLYKKPCKSTFVILGFYHGSIIDVAMATRRVLAFQASSGVDTSRVTVAAVYQH